MSAYNLHIYYSKHSSNSFKIINNNNNNFISDVLLEMKGLSPENDDFLDETEESFISVTGNPSLEDHVQSLETQPTISLINKQENSTDKKETNKLNKQVSWHDKEDMKNESSDSGDESSDEDESLEESKTVRDKCSSESACCKCDSGVGLVDQMTEQGEACNTKNGDESKGKEKDAEPGKFDGVFSDTDDSEGSAERYKQELCQQKRTHWWDGKCHCHSHSVDN